MSVYGNHCVPKILFLLKYFFLYQICLSYKTRKIHLHTSLRFNTEIQISDQNYRTFPHSVHHGILAARPWGRIIVIPTWTFSIYPGHLNNIKNLFSNEFFYLNRNIFPFKDHRI